MTGHGPERTDTGAKTGPGMNLIPSLLGRILENMVKLIGYDNLGQGILCRCTCQTSGI